MEVQLGGVGLYPDNGGLVKRGGTVQDTVLQTLKKYGVCGMVNIVSH